MTTESEMIASTLLYRRAEEHFAYGAGKQRSPTRRDWKRSRGAWSAGLSGAVRNRAAESARIKQQAAGMDEPGQPITVTLQQGPGIAGPTRMKILSTTTLAAQTSVGSRSISATFGDARAKRSSRKSVGAGYFEASIGHQPEARSNRIVGGVVLGALCGPVGPSIMSSALCCRTAVVVRVSLRGSHQGAGAVIPFPLVSDVTCAGAGTGTCGGTCTCAASGLTGSAALTGGAELLCSRNRRSSTGNGSTRVEFFSAATSTMVSNRRS